MSKVLRCEVRHRRLAIVSDGMPVPVADRLQGGSHFVGERDDRQPGLGLLQQPALVHAVDQSRSEEPNETRCSPPPSALLCQPNALSESAPSLSSTVPGPLPKAGKDLTWHNWSRNHCHAVLVWYLGLREPDLTSRLDHRSHGLTQSLSMTTGSPNQHVHHSQRLCNLALWGSGCHILQQPTPAEGSWCTTACQLLLMPDKPSAVGNQQPCSAFSDELHPCQP
ncbi:unnamed protein product [Merluccius merluccius]